MGTLRSAVDIEGTVIDGLTLGIAETIRLGGVPVVYLYTADALPNGEVIDGQVIPDSPAQT